jgi:hypothetical protein
MTYKLSNFYRTKGAKDEKERKKRNVKGYALGAFGAGTVGAAALGGEKAKELVQPQVLKVGKWYDKLPNKKALGVGLVGTTLAAGLGTKAYLNSQKNKRNQARYDNSVKGKVEKIKSTIKQKTKGSFNTLFPTYE